MLLVGRLRQPSEFQATPVIQSNPRHSREGGNLQQYTPISNKGLVKFTKFQGGSCLRRNDGGSRFQGGSCLRRNDGGSRFQGGSCFRRNDEEVLGMTSGSWNGGGCINGAILLQFFTPISCFGIILTKCISLYA
jgi:hypothetical protein